MSELKEEINKISMEERYKIVFLHDDDYELFKTLLGDKAKCYDYLKDKHINNFMTIVGTAVYVPYRHKGFLLGIAKKGGAI